MLIWKIVDFAKNWHLTSHNWVKYWPRTKNASSIASTRQEQSAGFSAKLYDPYFRNARGTVSTPPPPHVHLMKIGVHWRGLKERKSHLQNNRVCLKFHCPSWEHLFCRKNTIETGWGLRTDRKFLNFRPGRGSFWKYSGFSQKRKNSGAQRLPF